MKLTLAYFCSLSNPADCHNLCVGITQYSLVPVAVQHVGGATTPTLHVEQTSFNLKISFVCTGSEPWRQFLAFHDCSVANCPSGLDSCPLHLRLGVGGDARHRDFPCSPFPFHPLLHFRCGVVQGEGPAEGRGH